MAEYTFRRLNKNNIKDLVMLFLSCSKKGVNYKKFINKYNTDYTGTPAVGYLAYFSEDIPVAFYGVIPCLAKTNNQILKIAQATDALTHPLHQRKGLFSKLVLMTYEWAEEEGIHFIYGIPNDLSFPVYMNKLNWEHSGNMLVYKWRVITIPFSYFFKRFRFFLPLYRFYTFTILLFYKKSSCFPNPNCDETNFGILRSKEYFNYKQYQKKYFINVNGLTVWMSVDGALKIGDMEKSNPLEFIQVLAKIKILAFFLGTNKIIMQFSPNSNWINYLKNLHTPETGLPIIYLNLTNIFNVHDFAFSYGDIDTF